MKHFFLLIFLFPAFCFAQSDTKYDPAEDSLKIGQLFPPFNLLSLNDYHVESANIKKIIVLNFYNTSCPSCNSQIDQLNKLSQNFKNKDVVFLSICAEDPGVIRSFLIKHPFKYEPLVISYDSLSLYLQVANFPTNVIINTQKRVVYYHTGEATDLEELNEVYAEMKKTLTTLTDPKK